MVGLILLRLFLFLLPFLLFLLWLWALRRVRRADGTLDPKTERWINIGSAAGLAAMAIVAVVYIVNIEPNRSKVYIPPKEVDGEIQPGRFEEQKPQDKQPEQGGTDAP